MPAARRWGGGKIFITVASVDLRPRTANGRVCPRFVHGMNRNDLERVWATRCEVLRLLPISREMPKDGSQCRRL